MSGQYVGGKGDKRRKEDTQKIRDNWDKIFKDKEKNGSKQSTN